MDIINVYIPQLTYEYIFLHMFRKEAAKCPLTKDQETQAVKDFLKEFDEKFVNKSE